MFHTRRASVLFFRMGLDDGLVKRKDADGVGNGDRYKKNSEMRTGSSFPASSLRRAGGPQPSFKGCAAIKTGGDAILVEDDFCGTP